MASQYTIQPGDYLARIAQQNGFFDYRTIWDHAQNKQLKDLRKNPNVLAPGDILFIPDKTPKKESRPTGKTHRFRIKNETILLRLILEDLYGKPVANAGCDLNIDGQPFHVVSNADGKIEQEIPLTAQNGDIVVTDGKTPLMNVKLQIQIGYLDPVDVLSGQKARLSNLGYYLGSLDEDDDVQFRSAVEEFQCDNDLTVDGICGPNTQAKLKLIHGC
jgi:hypothetical protein